MRGQEGRGVLCEQHRPGIVYEVVEQGGGERPGVTPSILGPKKPFLRSTGLSTEVTSLERRVAAEGGVTEIYQVAPDATGGRSVFVS